MIVYINNIYTVPSSREVLVYGRARRARQSEAEKKGLPQLRQSKFVIRNAVVSFCVLDSLAVDK